MSDREAMVELGHQVCAALEQAMVIMNASQDVEFAEEVVAPLTSALLYLTDITHIGDN